jgi:hypothetical protein|tara:strand:+ start:1190 stop:1678 length:489 start_codon:yes stop_codon:yes gene_type:complete
MQDYKIIDNFLSKEEHKSLYDIMTGSEFPYYYNSKINSHDVDGALPSYFTHVFYNFHTPTQAIGLIEPIIKKIQIKSLIRIKANLYPWTEKLQIHSAHTDYEFTHKGAIYYLNTNDGKTILEDDTQIDSVANRMLFFDASKKHKSTNTTNTKSRININFNYF